MLAGLHPFEAAQMGFHAPRGLSAKAPPAPLIDLTESERDYTVTVEAPTNFSVTNLSAAEHKTRPSSIVVEGMLRRTLKHEYYARPGAAVYASPSRSALVGYLRASTVLRGSPPSSSGWIALDDGESFVSEREVVLTHSPPNPTPFAKRVDLPVDADLSRARVSSLDAASEDRTAKQDAPAKYRVVFAQGPRVAVRAGTHVNAPILGAFSRGDIIEGVPDDVDPNWIRLTGPSLEAVAFGGKMGARGCYVMTMHPTYGRLLAPLAPVARAPRANAPFVITVPRRMAKKAKTGTAPAARAHSASTAPRHEAATAKAPPMPATKEPTERAAKNVPTAADSGAKQRCESKPAQNKASEAKHAAQPPFGGALPSSGGAVLAECAPSATNVQTPIEDAVESWVAIEGGGFSRLITA